MMVPSVMPMTARTRLWGWSATWKPRSRFSKPMRSVARARPRAGPSAWARGTRSRRRRRSPPGTRRSRATIGDPPVAADPAHVEAHVERAWRRRGRGTAMSEHEARRRQQHLEHGRELLAGRRTASRSARRQRLRRDRRAGGDQEDGEPEGEEAALRPVGAPADAEAQRVPDARAGRPPISTSAVVRSAVRISALRAWRGGAALLLEQPALRHQVLVQLLGLRRAT